MDRFNELRKEIEKILLKSPISIDPKHSELTLKWVLELKPSADEALQIAALAHDIERSITGASEKDLKDYSKIDEYKREHAKRSAKIAGDLMKKHGYDDEIIERVQGLIEKHEEGGVGDAEVLTDADSTAYFDYNVPHYLERYGEERTKGKIKFMYKRLSEKGKKLVNQLKFEDEKIKELFQEVISEL